MFEAHVFVKSLCKKSLWMSWVDVLVSMSWCERRIKQKRMACRSDLGRDFDRYKTHPARWVKTLRNGGLIAWRAANNRVTTLVAMSRVD